MIHNLTDVAKAKGLSLIAWNARSVLNKIEEVDRLAIQAKPDFICITESWLNNTIDSAQVEIDGYNLHRSDRTVASGKLSGGGLLMYYNSKLQCVPIETLSFCDRNVEISFLQLT